MASDKDKTNREHLDTERNEFIEYQHKKLEKVAEIIKEEERAAKLLSETEKQANKPGRQSTVRIDSIVKHTKNDVNIETKPVKDDSNESKGFDMEGLSLITDDEIETSEQEAEINEDEATFAAVDEIVQASQNDFELKVDEPEELTLDTTFNLEEEASVTVTASPEASLVFEPLPEFEEAALNSREGEVEIINGLAIDTTTMIQLSKAKHEKKTKETVITASPEPNTQSDEDDIDEHSAELSEEGSIDFDAAEEEVVVESAFGMMDPTQPKISKIGRLLLELGKISRSDTKKILRAQKKHGLLFGDAALKLGLINDDDIQKVVAMQFNYHYLQAGQGKFSDDLIAAYAPFSKKVEDYRALRSQLMMRWFKKGHRALAIVGANSGDGVSYLTANLGVAFSQLGARTLIIEANMRSPRHQEIFNIRTPNGLSDMIVGKAGSEAIHELESIPDLSVLHAGTVPPNPQELLGRTSFNILYKTLSENYDVILIDTPPVVLSADAQSVIEMAEGAMLVSRLNHTRHTDVLDMRHLIDMTGATIVSAVMNTF